MLMRIIQLAFFMKSLEKGVLVCTKCLLQFLILTSFQPHLFSVDSKSSQWLRPWSRTSPAGECPVFPVNQLWMHTFLFSSLAVMAI